MAHLLEINADNYRVMHTITEEHAPIESNMSLQSNTCRNKHMTIKIAL